MAKQTQPGSFQIRFPAQDGPVVVDPTSLQITVRITNSIGGVDTFNVTISELSGASANSAVLTSADGGASFSGPVVAGPPLPGSRPPSTNKLVTAVGVLGSGSGVTTTGSQSQTFFAWLGSGSQGVQQLSAARTGGGIPRAKYPVPAAVQLRPTSGPDDIDGTEDGLVTLRYCDIPGQGDCWLSAPIDLGRPTAELGFWHLQRSDARTWSLRLRRGNAEIVQYRAVTVEEDDYALPVDLARTGTDVVSYPPTMTIVPAP